MNLKQRGFTLIELLVVVAIIGLLSSIVSVTVGSTRIKARDARRVADIKGVKTGLDLYFSSAAGYPSAADWNLSANNGTILACGPVDIMKVPKDPISPTYDYTYTPTGTAVAGCGTQVMPDYTLTFYIERKAAYYTLNQDGRVTDAGGTEVTLDSLLQ